MITAPILLDLFTVACLAPHNSTFPNLFRTIIGCSAHNSECSDVVGYQKTQNLTLLYPSRPWKMVLEHDQKFGNFCTKNLDDTQGENPNFFTSIHTQLEPKKLWVPKPKTNLTNYSTTWMFGTTVYTKMWDCYWNKSFEMIKLESLLLSIHIWSLDYSRLPGLC